MMKKNWGILLGILFFCSVSSSYSQQIGNIKAENVSFEHDGKNVYVTIDLPVKDYYIISNTSLSIEPVIISNAQMVSLPKIVLDDNLNLQNSATNAYSYQQMDNRYNIHYKVNVPYEAWMHSSKLILRNNLNRDDSEGLYTYSGVLKNSIVNRTTRYVPVDRTYAGVTYSESVSDPLPIDTPPLVSALLSDNIASSDSTLHAKIIELYYPNMRSSNILDMPENISKVEEVCSFIDNILRDKDYHFVGVYVVGHTSPEGIFYDNELLAKKRALGFKSYLQEGCHYPDSYFQVSGPGEDWAGLINLINKDGGVPYRRDVLDIINNVGVFKGREKQLMLLKGGDPYRYMKENLFPVLQRLECNIIYKKVKSN